MKQDKTPKFLLLIAAAYIAAFVLAMSLIGHYNAERQGSVFDQEYITNE